MMARPIGLNAIIDNTVAYIFSVNARITIKIFPGKAGLLNSPIGVVRINDIDGQSVGVNMDGILTKTAVKALDKALRESWEGELNE